MNCRRSGWLALVLIALVVSAERQAFAQNCRTGKPCGNTCIARSKTCHVGQGSARWAPDAGSVVLVGGLIAAGVVAVYVLGAASADVSEVAPAASPSGSDSKPRYYLPGEGGYNDFAHLEGLKACTPSSRGDFKVCRMQAPAIDYNNYSECTTDPCPPAVSCRLVLEPDGKTPYCFRDRSPSSGEPAPTANISVGIGAVGFGLSW